ncbi:MAG TPA: SDR family NAD(P)-dependent oxidoreductase [Brevefilum fermentans]|uniref:Short-chain dehydrogenase/reductase SDR n=1 Tax=Candidatus Brevifilum fermentans TaxID=1986204 RepID=A0A1Y6K3Z0_9CHLR|nr:SDR family NAD(P)-dependent oxidoreductase [Brevefilum fermentans]MDI9566197.1 SDR family NAD(P)-dependent oxidoreductase [Chloroflexota bacterium]SMX54405.1 Short-chain dehydrogenase/reductase SDR [Brevefilum fermentans]HQA29497.1 SDR family NAD(P)-dependent oxidoreductase [Brevefilum fermentans]
MLKKNFNLAGKSVLITGATSGIGLAAATRFAQEGAWVIGAGRSETRIQQAKNDILQTVPDAKIEFLLADLGYQQQVHNLAEGAQVLLAKWGYEHLDVLINNAGLYLEHKRFNDKKIEMTFAVNHLAAFVLTNQLLPWIKRAPHGRVITISSYAHKTVPINLKRISNPWLYIGLIAYKRSKLCNILFTSELNRRCQDIEAFAVDPGLVNTGIASKSEPGISSLVWRFHRRSGTDTNVPIDTLLFLSDVAISDLSNGSYYRDCAPQTPSRAARREDLARELWELSCQLTGIDWT